MTSRRALAVTTVILVVLAFAVPALCQPEPEAPEPEDPVVAACLSAFDRSQKLRGQKRLIDAKQALVACSQQTCPGVVTVKCQQWLEEVKRSIPTIVITAKDAGKDVFDVRVMIDGQEALSALDGTALEVDVGPRNIVAIRGAERRELTVLIVEGAKNRLVEFEFAPVPKPPPPPPPVPPSSGSPPEPASPPGYTLPVLSWIGFSVGAAGIIAGSITGGLSFERVAELEAKCPAAECPAYLTEESFGPATALTHASTISFAVGGAGIVLGIVGLLIDEPEESCQITSNGFSLSF